MKSFRAAWRLAAVPFAAACAVSSIHAQTSVVLSPATVTATRFPEGTQSLPFGVSVITREEIERSGASTVNEALMRVLGVVGRQDLYGGGEYSIDLRGFGANADVNQVVIVDGVRMSEGDLGGTRLAGIPIESVERIEVLRGSGAVLYGEGATGGVIVITTKSGAGKSRPNAATVHAAAGSFATRDLRGTANIGANGFSLDASAQKRDSDGWRDNFASKTDAQSLTGQWAGDNLRLGARYAQDRLDGGLPGALTTAQYAANPRQTAYPTDHANIRQDRGSVFADGRIAGWDVAFEAGERHKKLRSMNSGFAYDYDIAASSQSVRARNEQKFGELRNALVVGWDHQRWTRDVITLGTSARQTNDAWYAKDDLTFAVGTRLSLGARSERVRKDDNAGSTPLAQRLTAWELGVSHPIAAEWTAYGRVGRSFRLANADEFSFTNPAAILKPQTSRDVEAGVRWNTAATKLDARLYRSDLTDEIGFDPNAMDRYGPFGANVNLDPTRRQGFEVDASHQLNAALALRANAAVRSATFRVGPYAGRQVALAPHEFLAVRADWTPAAGHLLSGGVQWVSSQHPDFANACSMPAYTVADARYAYTWRNAELSLAVNNLADRKFYTQAYRCVSGQPSAIYPEAGRALTAALRLKF